MTTTLFRPQAQDGVLYVQCIGDVRCSLNGQELIPAAPIAHAKFEPAFDSWLPVQERYFALRLPAGASQLVIFTRPDSASGWWGIGATPLDLSGAVLT